MKLAKGMSCRKVFSEATKSANVLEGVEKVNDRLYAILNTAKGEIPMMPNFGSSLAFLLFEDMDEDFLDLIQVYIKDDIETQEPNVTVDIVSTKPEDNTVFISVYYHVSDNIRGLLNFSIDKVA